MRRSCAGANQSATARGGPAYRAAVPGRGGAQHAQRPLAHRAGDINRETKAQHTYSQAIPPSACPLRTSPLPPTPTPHTHAHAHTHHALPFYSHLLRHGGVLCRAMEHDIQPLYQLAILQIHCRGRGWMMPGVSGVDARGKGWAMHM